MKQKIKSFILDRRLALSLLILMWLIPQGVWAQHTHTFDEANDPGHTLCTGCGHSFFRYTATAQIKPYNGDNLKDASGNKLTFTHTFSDGQGVMEFNGTLTTIGIYVFYNCSFFTGDLIIPNGVTSIGESAFRYCSGFKGSLTIPNSVTTIEKQAFSKCSGFTGNLTIPNSVTSIGVEAFRECSGFTGDLVIPNSVTSIGERAFYYCSSFNGDLVIPNSLTSIGEYVFYGCNILQSVYNYATTPQVYNGLFSSDIYYNKPLYVPSASLAAYKEDAGWMKFLRISCIEHDFDEDGFCKGCGYDRMPRTDRILSKMELIGGVTAAISTDGDYEWRIDDKGNLSSTNRAINNTTSQTTITFTSKEAFVLSFDWSVSSETGYDKFTIQIDGVTKVDAVSGIKTGSVNDMKLTAGSHTLVLKYSKDVISAKNDDMASIANIKAVAEHTTHTFDEANDPGHTLCTGCGHSFFRYTAAARVDPKTPENLKDAGGNTLEYTTTFSDGQGVLEFNGTLTTIGQQAFYNRTAFTGDLIIPNGVTTIGDNAFQYCDGFKGNLVIPNSVISIERDAFYKCTGFKGNLVIPNGVASIGYRAFYGCTGFSGDLTIGNSVTTIGEASFYGCTGLSGDLIIPDGVTSIGTSAFRECSGFNVSLTIPNSVTSIGNYAFYGCTNLQYVYNYATTPQVYNGLFSSDIYDNKPLYVPSASLAAYKTASGWENFKSISCIEHTFDDETDPGHTLCTGCGHSFFRYTAAAQVEPYRPEKLMDASGNTLEYTNTFSDGQGVLEFNGTLTTIGERAFYNRDGFTGSLIIPNGVTSIGNYAFYECSGFTGSLTIGNGVTSIGNYAFYECSGFTGSLTIGNSVTSIGTSAFYNCFGFDGNLVIPNSVTSIGNHAFYNCSGFIGDLIIPNGVTTIENQAFRNCSGFTGDLIIPNGVTTIGEYAFTECFGFNGSLTIPNSVTSIGNYAFSGCHGFEGSLTIGNSVTSIGNYAFNGCYGFNGNLVIPNSVTSIGKYAFYTCRNLQSIYNYATTPQAYSFLFFSDIYNNKPLYVPSASVAAYKAASGWENFKSITCIEHGEREVIPAVAVTCSTSGSTEGSRCTVCQAMIEESVIIPATGHTFDDETDPGHTLCTGCGHSFFRYTAATQVEPYRPENLMDASGTTLEYTNTFSDGQGVLEFNGTLTTIGQQAFYNRSGFTGDLIIPNGVISIGRSAFWYCSGFNGSLTIGNSVTSIGEDAFWYCSGFNGSLTIGNSVTSIGDDAFAECSALTGDLIIPNSVTSIGDDAFIGCSGFNGSLTIGNSVASIGEYAFYECSGFNGSLTIGNSVASIGEYAFYSCSGFTGDLTIPNSVTSIGNYAFNGCSGFNGSLTIGNGVTSIGTSAFSFCSGFEGSLTIGNSVTSIGDDAFNLCSGFTGDLTIPNSVTSIGERAFYGCYFNGSLTIGNSVTSIGERAFYACDGLEGDLTIPNSVTTIGDRAFNDCCNLTGPLTIGNGVTSIGSSAFSGCSALTSVLLQSLPSMGSDVFSNVSAPKSISLTDESYIGTSTSNYPTFAGATYERKMGNEWGTLVLPFNVNYNDENGKYRFYKLKNAEDESMTFAPMANGNIAAGTPVVVKMIGDKGEDDKYTLSIEQSKPTIGLTVSAASCDAEGWTLNGTFQSVEQDCSEGNIYYIAENKFWFANQDFPLGAFRAYFQAPSAAGSSALRYFIVEEEATGIRTVEEEQDASQPQIYDLSGRRIQNAQHGLQIMNGKVIIKK